MKDLGLIKPNKPLGRSPRPSLMAVHYPPYALSWWLRKFSKLCCLCASLDTPRDLTLCTSCRQMMLDKQFVVLLPQAQQAGRTFRLYVSTFYQYPVNQLMSRFKEQEDLAAFFGLLSLVYQLPKPQGANKENTVIIPMPTTPSRMARRGFDPVFLLVKHLSYHWGLPIWQGVFRQERQQQRHLDRQGRLSNMQDGFYLKYAPNFRRAIIFDDVVTTGATMIALAKTLTDARPDLQILGLCLAHGSQDFNLTHQGLI